MEHNFLQYKNSAISYYLFGQGPAVSVCFHGYGEQGTLYDFFEIHAGDQHIFYAIDLPFHGQTIWNEGLEFSNSDLSNIVFAILGNQLDARNIGINLIGFSLGGRIALSFYQAHPGIVKKLILLAPDGLKVNSWYWLATQSSAGNRFFSYSMKKPAWFFTLLKLFNRLGWVNASVFKFVNFYIGNAPARELLYQRWTTLRNLKPALANIKSLVRNHKTAVRLVYGKYDRIILPSRGHQFRQDIEEYCTITVIDSGHQVIHPNHVGQLLPLLSD